MSSSADLLRKMARYNVWANQKILEELAPLEDSNYFDNCQLFFKSIHGTLNHVLLADRVWLGRMKGKPYEITGLDQELVSNREELAEKLYQQATEWVSFLNSLDDDTINLGKFTYTSTSGKEHTALFRDRLQHVFNHSTHHRGQISAAMTQYGLTFPALDLLYFDTPSA